MKFIVATLATFIATIASADGHLPNLEGKEVIVVTENAYPPLQFVEPGSGDAIGWEYDAMAVIAERINITVTYENISWDAMIPAVSEGQYDMGMTGITIRDDRKEKVDFSDAYMRSEMVMLVRGDEERFSDSKSFAADADLLMAAQPGTTPFYVGVYDVLDYKRHTVQRPFDRQTISGLGALLSAQLFLLLLALKPLLARFKTLTCTVCLELLRPLHTNLAFGVTVILHERNGAGANIRAGATFDAVEEV